MLSFFHHNQKKKKTLQDDINVHARLKNTAYQCVLFFSYSTYYCVTYLTDLFTSHLLLSTPPTPMKAWGAALEEGQGKARVVSQHFGCVRWG